MRTAPEPMSLRALTLRLMEQSADVEATGVAMYRHLESIKQSIQ